MPQSQLVPYRPEYSDHPQNLLCRPVPVIYRSISVRVSARISVGNGQSAVGSSRDCTGKLTAVDPEVVVERVVLIGITVRSAVDRQTHDVARCIESSCAEYALQVGSNMPLDGLKRGRIYLPTTGRVLFAHGKPRLAGGLGHVHDNRFIRRPGVVMGAGISLRTSSRAMVALPFGK